MTAIRRSVDASLPALCLMALFSLAIKTENAGLRIALFSLRLVGTGAGIAFLKECEHVPTRIEAKLIEEAKRLESERIAHEQWRSHDLQAFERSRASLEQEREQLQGEIQKERSELQGQIQKEREQLQQETQRERDAVARDRTQLEKQRLEFQQQLERDLAHHEQRVSADIQRIEQMKVEALAQAESYAQQVADALNQELEAKQYEIEVLTQRLRQAEMPIPPLGVRTIDRNCWDIQLLFWRNEIILDCNREQPHDSPTYQEFLLYPRKVQDLKKIKSPEMVDQIEAILNSVQKGGIKIEQYGAAIAITFKKDEDSRIEKEKKP